MVWKIRTLARPEHKIIIPLIIVICDINTNNSEASPGPVVSIIYLNLYMCVITCVQGIYNTQLNGNIIKQ